MSKFNLTDATEIFKKYYTYWRVGYRLKKSIRFFEKKKDAEKHFESLAKYKTRKIIAPASEIFYDKNIVLAHAKANDFARDCITTPTSFGQRRK